ncbi:hypothetical protein M378DRAFT_18893 [Amanita muscaria Koide BX008]|uniref:Uncharacterized protein n=1 Tax=Amanita muscaria (strain Koide BX008) TaxID=946122 RepID=A0A0C2WEF9_AMAMK|nr:hypothetical protein M378DRAFT_18893 [Amanita muscaria Koide BX008]
MHTNIDIASKRRSCTIVHVDSPPNTPGYLGVAVESANTVSGAESETESETESENDNDITNEPNAYGGDNENDKASPINKNLEYQDTSSPWSIQNQLGLPSSQLPDLGYWHAACTTNYMGKEPEPKRKDIAIQTDGLVEVKSVEREVVRAQYGSLNIEMTGGTINKPVFNVVTNGHGKRKSTKEDKTIAKKTKKAKLN